MKTPLWHSRLYSKSNLKLTIASDKFNRVAYQEARFVIEKLGLKSGDWLLDVPCGTGRHAKVLATSGVRVTAVDINPECLKWAKKYTKGLPIIYQIANMANLSQYRGQFDALANLFTSFGYFDTDVENEKVMKEFVSCLKPRGKVVLSTINKDWLLKVFRPVSEVKLGKDTIIEAREYHPDTQSVSAHWFLLNQNRTQAQVFYNKVRLYSKNEMVNLMKKCGLKKVKVYGNFEGQPFKKYLSHHPVYIGEKA